MRCTNCFQCLHLFKSQPKIITNLIPSTIFSFIYYQLFAKHDIAKQWCIFDVQSNTLGEHQMSQRIEMIRKYSIK